MQTLNVGAGQSDSDYKAGEEAMRADLRAESRSDANWFFWAAGVAALGTGLLPVRLNFIVSIGIIDLITFYGRALGPLYEVVIACTTSMWLLVLVGLGFAGRKGYRWAFFAGIALYSVDMVALLTTFSIWAFAAHFVFVFKWFQGQRALKELNETTTASA